MEKNFVTLDLIKKATDRACELDRTLDKTTVSMDLYYCLDSISLDLEKLILSDEFNFMHDIYGIGKNINRATGKMNGLFEPRCIKIKEEKDGK